MAEFEALSKVLVSRRNKVHLAVFILTILMIPGALKALEPIDMESYDMESPELTAERKINDEFATTEIILGFVVSVRDPAAVGSTPVPVPLLEDGTPDWSSLPPADEAIDAGEEWVGITDTDGGILNLTILREIQSKHQIVHDHALGNYTKPFINDVTGLQTSGVMSLADIFRGFMANESILTHPTMTLAGLEPAQTNWDDCGILECLTFEDEDLTQAHIDLAASRMAAANGSAFLRWLSLDRGFVKASENTGIVGGPIGGALNEDGTWRNAEPGPGRWSASASWLLVQLDRAALEEVGWTTIWKDAHPEKEISFTDDGLVIGGYRLDGMELVLQPPEYTSEYCLGLDNMCSLEWSVMHLEGSLRSHDNNSLTLVVGQAVNVEVNRELQNSGGLIFGMGIAIIFLLYASLRRWSDVAIVSLSLGGALLWMQGLIGHSASLLGWLGIDLISRSQFSNLLPILVLALGIDDSLHALHRYKEERNLGNSPQSAGRITVNRVGRAIILTSLTTMAAFGANLFSDVAALRSFGLEAGLGILAAFLLTGIWAPLLRISFDEWLEKRGKNSSPKIKRNIIRTDMLQKIAIKSGTGSRPIIIAGICLLLTIPAAWGMVNLEGEFSVDDFLDEDSDFAFGVDMVNERFSDEGEPAMLLIEGDVADPEVFRAIDDFRQNADKGLDGGIDKMTRQPDGKVDILAIDEFVIYASASMVSNPEPFWGHGFNESGCEQIGILNAPNLDDRDCIVFFYGVLTLDGVPGTEIPSSLIDLYIAPSETPDPERVWLSESGKNISYDMMLIRFGITSPDDFPSMGPGIDKIKSDLGPLLNLSSGTWEEEGASEDDKPLTWVMLTGKPITRFVASDKMQSEMQSSLLLGSLFVLITLSIGFRSVKQAIVSLTPILLVVVWLYGLIYAFGYSLNIVTVTIATISLGVGIDYCIHVTERYREGREKGGNHRQALHGVGGACALALVGSAISDVAGFSIIATSSMGLFNTFGLFSAMMIVLSLIASMVLTTAALGIIEPKTKSTQEE
ncbi:MAG: MMPL family transporter [Euryarchaeota archaeon]|jgi:predicted RND superfamily exporter protein|nr:MMPL family transporter [Euryarchaeota archaeon]MBT4982968.1 MMPL family transporter [Euryarchaeota archaeon]